MCHAVSLILRSPRPYGGLHFAFGDRRPNFFKPTYGYKARFDAPARGWGTVTIPFTNFTSDWNDETGDPVHTCQENSRNCPDRAALRDLKTVGFWAEGVTGQVHLEVKAIRATECNTSKAFV